MSFVRRFLSDTAGATAIEYSLIAALIGAVLVAVITDIGQSMGAKFNNVANATQ
jgi:pilus assembly protein Flp/PilA